MIAKIAIMAIAIRTVDANGMCQSPAAGLSLLVKREWIQKAGSLSASHDGGEFVPVDGGVNRACRGFNANDNLNSYYDLFTKPSLDECKELCMQAVGCQGIEFSNSGRCEIWTRADGIGASRAAFGYTCMKYQAAGTGASTTIPPAHDGVFVAVDGGVNRACRGFNADDSSDTYYSLFIKPSLDDCKLLCGQTVSCQGIEFSSSGRCEIWTRADGIGASRAAFGYTCMKYQAASTPRTTSQTTTSTTQACRGEIRWANHPDKCLNVANGGTEPGTNVQLWDCTSNAEDSNFLIPEGGRGLIHWAVHPSLCLGVAGGSHADGTKIQLEVCDSSSPNQTFRVTPDNSSHTIQWDNNLQKCLDVQDGSRSNGANLQLWWCLPEGWEHTYNQQFLAGSSGSCEGSSTDHSTDPISTTRTTTASIPENACCSEFGKWPDVDGVTCGSCRALVSTAPYGGRCDKYCESFGHACVEAAEESDESCSVKYSARCEQVIHDTSDMLCTCQSPTAPATCSSPAPSPSPSLVWFDEFDGDGSIDGSKWGFDLGGGGWGNNELQFYTDRLDNSRREGGVLKVIAKCEDYGGNSFTSARLVSRDRGDWGPGHRIEVRAKIPTGRGTWPAIWMLPTDWEYGGWPDSGEIDIMEHVGCNTGSVVGTIHTEAFNHMKHTEKGNSKWLEDVGAWHTYAIEWQDTILHWYVDGIHYHNFTGNLNDPAEWPFNKRFHLLLNIAVGGNWGGYCLNGNPPSCNSWEEFRAEQVMEVDYVRVYAL